MGQRRGRGKFFGAMLLGLTTVIAPPTAHAGIAFVNIADDTTGQFSTLGQASINDKGQVLFSAALQGGGSGIYLDSVAGGASTTVADTLGGFSNVAHQMINDNGVICYGVSFDVGGTGIYRTGVNGATPHVRRPTSY